MKRVSLLLASLLTVILGITLLNVRRTSGQQPHHQKHEPPPAKVDGAVNPEGIPDHAAYEMVFRLITAPDLTDRGRANLFKMYGLSEIEAAILKSTANTFIHRIASLDSRAKSIKDTHWPTPSAQVMAELSDLQRQKERIIEEIVSTLSVQVTDYDYLKVRGLFNNTIKSRIKSFPTELPQRRIGRLEWLARPGSGGIKLGIV